MFIVGFFEAFPVYLFCTLYLLAGLFKVDTQRKYYKWRNFRKLRLTESHCKMSATYKTENTDILTVKDMK